MQISPRAVWMLVATNLLTLGALVFLTVTGFASQATQFDVITAERINIVNPAGKTVIAISNKERIAGPVIGGQAYPAAMSEGREHMAGMIFFNQEGDEMGGLLFNSFKLPSGRVAGIGHLSFDRFNDNQVLSLQYNENAAGVRSGVTFYDRPGGAAFATSFALMNEARTATPERLAQIKESLAAMRSDGELGVERVFVGSANQVAQFVLKDSKGRIRARMMVDAKDEARLEFLDDAGNVTARFPK